MHSECGWPSRVAWLKGGGKLWALLSWGPEICEFLDYLLISWSGISLPYQQDSIQQLFLGYKLFLTVMIFLAVESKTNVIRNQE